MNYLVYIPPDYRQHNIRASCVHASVTNCMRIVGLWEKADKYWNRYKGDPNGESAGSIRQKLNGFGIKHLIVRDEESLIQSLKAGRAASVTWGGPHCVNLVGLVNGNAYIVDNERPSRYIIQPWRVFMSNFYSSGGWSVIILDGTPPKSIDKRDLRGFDR